MKKKFKEILRIQIKIMLTKKQAQEICFLKNNKEVPTVSYAVFENKKTERAGNIQSYNHLLDITSEQGVLALCVSKGKYNIKKIITKHYTNKELAINPLNLKVIIDFNARTGSKVTYEVVNNKKTLYKSTNVDKVLPFYTPTLMILDKINKTKIKDNLIILKNENKEEMLKIGASIGIAIGTGANRDFVGLIDQADKAMYKVKNTSKSAVAVYKGNRQDTP